MSKGTETMEAKLTEAEQRALAMMCDRQFASGEFYRRWGGIHPRTISRLETAGFVETYGDVHNERIVDLHWRITDEGRAALARSTGATS